MANARDNISYEEQVNAWVAGDERAFRRVFDYFYPRLLAASHKMMKNRENAEELVMNVLLKTWLHRQKIASVVQLDEYLFGILRQQIAGFARKRAIVAEPINDIPLMKLGTASQPELSMWEIRERYEAALLKLTPQQRRIFLMSREEQYGNNEIAARTGLSVHTVNNHIKASLKVMHREFQDNPEIIGFVLAATPFTLFFT